MIRHLYGEQSSSSVLVQMVDDHDLSVMDSEVRLIREMAGKDFLLIAMKVGNWNHDLTPWGAKAVFGSEDFGDGAEDTLKAVLEELRLYDRRKKFYIGGYSLAGLLAAYALFRLPGLAGAVCCSGSLWFPGFSEYAETHPLAGEPERVYLSLGDKEKRSRNPVLSRVEDCTLAFRDLLLARGADSVFRPEPGNHFQEPDKRMARGIAWCLERRQEAG